MAENIKVGDTVKLKSGSPAMTVTQQARGGRWRCEWFDHSMKKHHADFPADALEIVDLSDV